MTAMARCALVAVVGVVSFAIWGGAAVAAGPPSAACNGGGCGGWFRSSVTVTWSYDPAGVTNTSGCGSATLSDDTSGATFTCTVWYGAPFYGNSVTVRKDSSPPGVNVELARGPDSGEWYTRPVSVEFKGDDGASGVASCTSGTTYSGPDGGAITLSGSCTDNAGNSGSGSATIKYDATPPTVTAEPSRPPDANGWYNHAVQVAFKGADAGSGVAECSPPVEYKGPDASPAKLVAQCRDAAGHVSAPLTFELRYDATPPARPTVKLAGSKLTWATSKDVVRAEVVRAPGLKTTKAAIVFAGAARRFVDTRTKPGVRYWYEVRVYDQAGNRAARSVSRGALLGLYSPVDGAVVTKAPVLAWVAVPKARFYNVQLWRGRRKLLTTWLRSTKFHVPTTWMFQGRRQRLGNGGYAAYVWPAFGTTRDPRYGRLVGRVDFVVRRR
jgi:hypothetical protein